MHGRYTCNTPHRLIISLPGSMSSLSTLCLSPPPPCTSTHYIRQHCACIRILDQHMQCALSSRCMIDPESFSVALVEQYVSPNSEASEFGTAKEEVRKKRRMGPVSH